MIELPPPGRRYEYERDPAAIYRRSFAMLRAETDLTAVPADLRDIAVRLVHACGMPDILPDLAWSDGAGERARTSLADGAPVLVDSRMVEHGINAGRLPQQNEVICTLDAPGIAEHARRLGTTRSAAAVDLWRDRLDGAVVAIGNAPTALFHLLERIAEGFPKPAVVLGFPVGFVGAAESKQALAQNPFGVPFLTLRGRRGGSALAAAAVNALAAGLPEETTP